MDSWWRKQGAEAAYHSAFEKYAGTLEEKWNLLASKFDAFYGQIQADVSRSEGPYRALEVYAPPEKRMGRSDTGTHGQTYPFLHADPDASPPPIAPIYASPPFPLEKSKKDAPQTGRIQKRYLYCLRRVKPRPCTSFTESMMMKAWGSTSCTRWFSLASSRLVMTVSTMSHSLRA